MSKVICPEPGSQLTIGSVTRAVYENESVAEEARRQVQAHYRDQARLSQWPALFDFVAQAAAVKELDEVAALVAVAEELFIKMEALK